MNSYLEELGKKAREASFDLASLSTKVKNDCLLSIADALTESMADIISANKKDLEVAETKGIGAALLDRLRLDEKRLVGIINDVRKVVSLDDPVGMESGTKLLPNGLRLTRRRIPIGVIGVIYEARPNVTVDIVSLCIKTGNVCILRGGSETINSNLALVNAIRKGMQRAGVSSNCVQFIEQTDRSLVTEMLKMDQYIDMIIPRGGAKLSILCREQSTIPVIVGGFGISHIYVDYNADLERTVPVIINAKVQRPSACNSLDTLLICESVAERFIPLLVPQLNKCKVKIVAEGPAFDLFKKAECENLSVADENTFDTEWLDLVMGVKIVKDIDEALLHLRKHNATHSDSIMTNDHRNAEKFVNNVGSAAAYINASTRFTDGGQFGLGAEVAISTQKLHAHGPMGLEELTSYRWICEGDYLSRS